MKKNLFTVMMLAVATLFVACNDDDDKLEIKLNPPSISGISYEGTTKEIKVNSPIDWNLSIPTDCKWLHADETSGKANVEATVTFTIDPNDGDARNVNVTVSGNGASVTINVAQNAYVAPEAGEVKFPSTVNLLSATGTFEPFVYEATRADDETEDPEYDHLIVYADGDNEGDLVAKGSATTKTAVIDVANWGTYKFQYIAWVDLNGDGKMDEGEFEEGDEFTIKFEAPATGATLALVTEDDAYTLKITGVQDGIKSYGLFKDGELMSGLYIPAEEGQEQDVTESGKYTVKGLYGGNYGDDTAVWGNASNEVDVTIPAQAD